MNLASSPLPSPSSCSCCSYSCRCSSTRVKLKQKCQNLRGGRQVLTRLYYVQRSSSPFRSAATRSSVSSMPQDTRTKPSVIPTFNLQHQRSTARTSRRGRRSRRSEDQREGQVKIRSSIQGTGIAFFCRRHMDLSWLYFPSIIDFTPASCLDHGTKDTRHKTQDKQDMPQPILHQAPDLYEVPDTA